ncbi:nucleolar protein 19 [[Candida] jaroonii]|uniref:Nucleolar protein 19 n=1 Tax=[Candida] jaroonii TaxID=467808 RepID=A0ACA9YE68_9ASCO|nr:nucleolar protein 19 [[Candida] jaroonii]
MSRRQEIKDKEILQLKFQSAIQSNNDMIKKWLNPSSNSQSPGQGSKVSVNGSVVKDESKSTGTNEKSNETFFGLPVIAPGKSLSTLAQSEGTIGKYLDGKSKTNNTSQPMNSLLNKLKTSQRNERQNNKQFTLKNQKISKKPKKTHKVEKPSGDNSSDEEEKTFTTAKKAKLLF